LQATQHGGDDYDKIVRGDPGLESIYNWTQSGPSVSWRGATGRGDGVHILTGAYHLMIMSITASPDCIVQLWFTESHRCIACAVFLQRGAFAQFTMHCKASSHQFSQWLHMRDPDCQARIHSPVLRAGPIYVCGAEPGDVIQVGASIFLVAADSISLHTVSLPVASRLRCHGLFVSA